MGPILNPGVRIPSELLFAYDPSLGIRVVTTSDQRTDWDPNFEIVAEVEPGTYFLEVRGGANADATGAYGLYSNAYRIVPLVQPASDANQRSFVRIINRTDREGWLSMFAVDDTGRHFHLPTLSLESHGVVQFNSRDMEQGNPSKGLTDGIGRGSGNWKLWLRTNLHHIEPLGYVVNPDSTVTSMHGVSSPATDA